MKSYEDAQREKTPKPEEGRRSGVECTEPECGGEMVYAQPEQKHPELTELFRAICEKCGWRGWC